MQFNFSFKASLVVMNSFSFCLSEKLFLLQFQRAALPGRVFLVGNFFSFSTLNISFHSFLAYKVSAEISPDSLIGVLLYVTSCFYLSAFKILFFSLIFDNLIIMCFCMGLFRFILFGMFWVSCVWMSVSFLRLGKFSAIISLNKLSFPFSRIFFCDHCNVIIVPFDDVP